MNINEPLSDLTAAAVQLNEIYLSYINAGFNEWQSFELVKATLIETLRQARGR